MFKLKINKHKKSKRRIKYKIKKNKLHIFDLEQLSFLRY